MPRKVLLFSRKISTGMNRSISILPGIFGFSIQMLSAPDCCLKKTEGKTGSGVHGCRD